MRRWELERVKKAVKLNKCQKKETDDRQHYVYLKIRNEAIQATFGKS